MIDPLGAGVPGGLVRLSNAIDLYTEEGGASRKRLCTRKKIVNETIVQIGLDANPARKKKTGAIKQGGFLK